MKIDQQKKATHISSPYLRAFGLLLASNLLLAAPLLAADFSLAGESTTILRMRTTTEDKDLYPLYEYLHLNAGSKLADGANLAFYLGAWGRVDLADKTTDRYSDKDLQYGYLSYRAAKNNLVVNLGRQFVSEGIAAEKLDGIYLRSDFLEGVSAAAFVGSPVLTETDFKGADLVYGGRISHSMPKYYSIGFSALKNEANDSSRYREEKALDLWVHPLQQLDLTGRSAYNSVTKNWMEHAYVITLSPLDNLKLSGSVTNINYRDYFHNVTTKALSMTNGILENGESFIAVGTGASYTFLKDYTVAADYKNYNYDIAGDANYYGGKVTALLPGAVSAGGGYHRMDGASEKLKYSEYRLYALKKLGHMEMSADFIDINYDKSVNGIRDSFSVTGSLGYEFNEKLKLVTDLDYSRNPDFAREVRGFVKVIYAFDSKRSEGRSKSEK